MKYTIVAVGRSEGQGITDSEEGKDPIDACRKFMKARGNNPDIEIVDIFVGELTSVSPCGDVITLEDLEEL